jgi:predicted ATPase/DNA-binding winged helix-turn-helix (wHTH) protein
MAPDEQISSTEILAFGPFQFLLKDREVREAGQPLRLGSRALEILQVLLERAGQLVSKSELLTRVWPDTVVEEATLRVHIAALRKALGDGLPGRHYVENVSGRGYRFLAPVARLREKPIATATLAAEADHSHNVPGRLTRMIGRTPIVDSLATRLRERRLVTVVGPGGIGKTTVALAVAERVASSFRRGARFVDLASIADARHVAQSVASTLGSATLTENPLCELTSYLKDKHMLIVLDNCEHVIDAAAVLAEKILRSAPAVQVLATSREPLRAEGEWVERLTPLETPDTPATLTANAALSFPAVQLFVERAMASLDTFELDDENAPVVAEICCRLDGNPLAIELAAARVDLFGIRMLAARLDRRLQILTRGRRTALARQQTLRATLDWSYDLLSPVEQIILRRVALFPGAFDAESAARVAADERMSLAEVFDGIGNLAAKSLIVTDGDVLYRLLDTPRAYALEKLRDSGELAAVNRRYVQMCCAWNIASCPSAQQRPADWLMRHSRKIEDLQAALDWCFSPAGHVAAGVKLSLVTSWLQLLFVSEYRGRLEDTLQTAENAAAAQVAWETQLDRAIGDALLHTTGAVSPATKAVLEALEFAQRLGDAADGSHANWNLWIERIIATDYRAAREVSERFRSPDMMSYRPATLSDRMLLIAHHYAGDQTSARRYAERLLAQLAESGPAVAADEADQHHYTQALLSRILYLQGFPDQAARAARETVTKALSTGHSLMLCYSLISACTVMLWTGDLKEAQRLAAMLLELADRQSLAYWQIWGLCFDMAAAVRMGHASAGDPLERSQDPLSGSQYLEVFNTVCEELVSEDAIVRAESGRAGWVTAEVLRVRGERLLKAGKPHNEAEAILRNALEIARREGALSWELRAATSLARIWREQGRSREARELLAAVYARFTEGYDTADLVKAGSLLAQLE